MGNTFSFLKPQSKGGFQFTVLGSCKAEGVDLNQTCSLHFGPNHELQSIGNITRGNLTPRPGIAGQGIWLGMLSLFLLISVAVCFVVVELMLRFKKTRNPASNGMVLRYVYGFQDPPDEDVDDPNPEIRYSSRIRAAIREFVLAASDSQTILVGALILGFAGQGKCQLTSYHFTVAVDLMMISLSIIVFSVALVRSYWENPLTAGFRALLSVGAFVGVGLTIFGKNNYSQEWPPHQGRNDSAILLPVACLLERDLWLRAKNQTSEHQADLGFQSSSAQWPTERLLYIFLLFAFLIAHASIGIRRCEGRHEGGNLTPQRWSAHRGWFTVAYWSVVLSIPTASSVWCWDQVRKAREWVKNSGWIRDPNPEFNIWDSGQLIPLGGFILILMAILTQWKSRRKAADGRYNKASWARIPRSNGSDRRRMQGAQYERRPPVLTPLATLGH